MRKSVFLWNALVILAFAFTILKPENYRDLRAVYQKVAATDQQQLALTASPAGASK